jgi:hypothetical protein
MRSPVEPGTPKASATGFMSTGLGGGDTDAARRRVRVWFGSEVICSHEADPCQAQRYAMLMSRRFAGLRVTIDDQPGARDTALPDELLWDSTVM